MRSLIFLSIVAVAGCTPAPATTNDYKPLIAVALGQAISSPLPSKAETVPTLQPCADCAKTVALQAELAAMQQKYEVLETTTKYLSDELERQKRLVISQPPVVQRVPAVPVNQYVRRSR